MLFIVVTVKGALRRVLKSLQNPAGIQLQCKVSSVQHHSTLHATLSCSAHCPVNLKGSYSSCYILGPVIKDKVIRKCSMALHVSQVYSLSTACEPSVLQRLS